MAMYAWLCDSALSRCVVFSLNVFVIDQIGGIKDLVIHSDKSTQPVVLFFNK